MSKVLVDRELLEKWADKLEGADSAGYGWEDLLATEVRGVIAQPAEAEGLQRDASRLERWHAVSADWKETSVAIHGERSGYIACGIPEEKAHAIIKAHNIGLPEECAAKEG